MLNNIDKDSTQEQMIIYFIIYSMFQNMNVIWLNIIVIDKIYIKYKSFMRAIIEDYFYLK